MQNIKILYTLKTPDFNNLVFLNHNRYQFEGILK
jgi:hypothetical protein